MRGKTIVRYAALATVLFLQSGASAQAVYFSATGTFAAANGQFEDFNFTLPGTLSTTLKTLAWSGGTNAAGQTVAAGGIDSILSLYNGSGTLLYSNDDANDGNASTRDSVLSPTGTGSSLIPPLGAGNYRLRMTNFQSSIGDGHWATDLTVPASSTFTLTGITGSGNSTLSALYFGSSGLGTATFLLNPGTTVSAGLVNVQDGGILNLNGGTLLGGNENIFGNNASALQNGGLNAPFRLQVGPIGAGTYTLNAGTLVTTTLVKIGDNNSAGIFIQNGGTVQATTDLLIGSNGNSSGTYTLNAGSLSTSDVLIASSATDSGTFNQLGGAVSGLSLVVGGSSAITNSPGGNGYCALFTGATATFTDTVKIYGNGLLNITGGTLNAGTIDNTGGGFFFFNSGTLHLTGSNVTIGSTGVLGANPNLSFNRNLVVDGTTTIQSGAALTINGGYFSSGAISNSGSIQFTSGTLRLSNSSLTVGNSGLLGNVVQLNSAQHVDVVGNAIVNNGALLYLSGGSLTASNFATVAFGGEIQLATTTSLLSSSVIANNGLIDGSGRIVGSLSNTSTGEIRVGASDRLVFSGADGNNGTFSLYGGTMEFTDPLGNFPTGRIVGRGVINARGGISNDGTISFSAGFTDVSGGSLSNNNGSKVIITGGSTSTFYGAVTNNAGSEFRVSTASTAVFLGTVTGLGAFTGSGIKDFEGAALAGPLVTSGSSIVEAPSVLTAQYIREAALTVNGRASIVPNGTAASVSRLNVLNISGGKFDLADNDLVIDSTSLATIQSLIKSGFSGGSWSGQGLTSSTAQSIAADNANPHKTALGYASASSIGVTTFDGQSVGGSSVLVRYTWSGDANLDGKVNALDFNALASNFGGASNKLWNEGDFNYDGTVNTADFNALASNFNLALPAPALGTLVPEPMLMALAAPSLLVLARRRRY